MTQFITDVVDEGVSTLTTWTDLDLSSKIPVGATGAIIQVTNASASAVEYGLRKKGSTDDRHGDCYLGSQNFAFVGVDENRKCQYYIENADVNLYVVGYTESDAVMFTNAYDKSSATLGWADIDCSSELPAGAIAAIFDVVNTHLTAYEFGLRMKGSTDNRHEDIAPDMHVSFVVGVDGDRKCQMYIESDRVDLYLLGYLTAGQTFKNGVDQSLATYNTYVEITETSDGVCSASGVFGDINSSTNRYFAVRKKGATYDTYLDVYKKCGFVAGLDENKKWEGKVESYTVDFFILGYFSRTPKIREHYVLPNVREHEATNVRVR